MIRGVEFLPRRLVETYDPPPGNVLISITEAHDDHAALRPGWKEVHRTWFDDVDAGQTPRDIAGLNLLTDEKAEALALWLKSVHALPDPLDLVVHCSLGQSRSPGVAKAAAVYFELKFEQCPGYNDRVYMKVLRHLQAL